MIIAGAINALFLPDLMNTAVKICERSVPMPPNIDVAMPQWLQVAIDSTNKEMNGIKKNTMKLNIPIIPGARYVDPIILPNPNSIPKS